MAKIPVGSFGFSVPAPVDRSPITQAQDRLGQIVSGVGARIYETQQALARAKDASAYQEHALEVDKLKANYADKIASGDVPYETARQKFDEDAAKIPMPAPAARDPAAAEALARGASMSIKRAGLDIDGVARVAQDKDLQSQGVTLLDTLGKRVSLPGADVASINAQADAVAPVLRAGGLTEAQVTRTLQNFKDGNWYNDATKTAMQARESLPALKQLEHDLTASDGYYVGKLDTDKRNAVLQQVISHRIVLENRMQAQGDRREAAAERAAVQIERQISSGVPATADMWSDWEGKIRGTSIEPQFKELVASEREIQDTLRAPIADQVRLVQQRQADLDQNGGTLAQKANADRLSRAVSANIKQLTTNPVQFAAERLGDQNAPVRIGDPGADQANTAELQDRATRIRALPKQFGIAVPMRPLLPQEAKQVSAMLEGASPSAAADLMNHMRDVAGSPDVFRGILSQVAPDQPVKAAAGVLASMQRELTTGTHWFAPDDTVSSRDVAATMLKGEAILSPSGAVKKEDGKPQTQLFMTEAAAKGLQDEFGKVVGDTFRGNALHAEQAFQNVRAYYVGRASDTGAISRDSQTVDSNLVREAVHAVLGNIVDYNGNGRVLAPWGMSDSQFEDRLSRSLPKALTAAGLSPGMTSPGAFGLEEGPADGQYVVTIGRRWVRDARNQPVIVDIRPPDARDARGFIQRGGQ